MPKNRNSTFVYWVTSDNTRALPARYFSSIADARSAAREMMKVLKKESYDLFLEVTVEKHEISTHFNKKEICNMLNGENYMISCEVVYELKHTQIGGER